MEEMNPCRLCERPWHSATGAIYCEGYLVCGHCEREFWTWVRNRTNAKPSKKHQRVPTARSFYEAAGDHLTRDEGVRTRNGSGS